MVVVGAGLAGMSAALRLAERGVAVTLLETRKRLGGRASSFVDPETDRVLDQCQHAVMPACTYILDFYERLGLRDVIQWDRTIHFSDGRGGVDRMQAGVLPAPFHLAGSFLRMKGLGWRDKLAVAWGMQRMLWMGKAGRRTYRGRSIGEVLDGWGQPASARRRFWDVVIVSACNDEPERVDAELAIKVFQEGFLSSGASVGVGVPRVPLVALYEPLERALEAAGGCVRLGASVAEVCYGEGRVRGVRLSDGEIISAAEVVVTVPPDRLAKMTGGALAGADERLRDLGDWRFSPIVAVHLFFEMGASGVMKTPHLVTADRPIDWIFNKGETGLPEDVAVREAGVRVQHVHALKSGAHDLVKRSAAEILDLVEGEVRAVLPEVAGRRLLHGRVIKEKVATFCASPAMAGRRPGVGGGVAGLYLAGDWADTGWPATMEGAVRSGYEAAEVIMQRRGGPGLEKPGELRAEGLSRWLLG